MSKTCLLMSGGLDSIALAYWKRPDLAITIDYGQVCAEAEIKASAQVCQELHIRHNVVRVDCGDLGSGDLAGRAPSDVAPVSEWWPFRNQLLLTLAGMAAVSLGTSELWIGVVQTDCQHADGTMEFISHASALMEMQEGGIRVGAPAISMTTVDLIRAGDVPIALLSWAHSCHTSNWACGCCRGCNKHRQAMEALGHGNY